MPSAPSTSCAGRAGEQQVLMPLDPLATGQAMEQGPIEAAGGVMIDVLGGGLLAQAGEPQPGRQALGIGLPPVEWRGEIRASCG